MHKTVDIHDLVGAGLGASVGAARRHVFRSESNSRDEFSTITVLSLSNERYPI
jgi:hypothetical protein